MTDPANAASREARARELLAEIGQERRVLHSYDDTRCYLAPNQVLPAMLALADEAASQPREGVEVCPACGALPCDWTTNPRKGASQPLDAARDAVIAAARRMPRATPAPGSCVTVHQFGIEAGVVWVLDRTLTELDALHDTAPIDQAQRGGEVERIAQAIHAHSPLATSWWEDLAQDDRDTFEDAARAALAQSGKAVISTPDMPKGGEQ